MSVPGQSQVVYTYDNANRLSQITQGTSTVTFGYDNANRRTSLTLPNNILVEYAYDAASRLTGITYKQNGTTVLGNLTYEYDKAGNRTNIGGSWARTGMPQNVTTTSYDANNRQLTFGDKTLTYDDNGNLQSITDSNGTTLYSWNARNQLVGISGPNVSANFVYDGLGRREKKTINGSLTEFLYDGVNAVQETSGSTVLANILTGLGIDEFLTHTDVPAATTSYFLPDGLRSLVALTDPAGAVQTEYTYEPFGRTTATGMPSSNPFQYTGRENDGTGLYYHRARYCQSQLQRFISEDPIEFYGGEINLYAYVGSNPINLVDPLGLDKRTGCNFASTFASSFNSRLRLTNAALFSPLAQALRTGAGLVLGFGTITANALGTVGPLQAMAAVATGQGVANITIGFTALSGALTAAVTGISTTAALEAGVVIGSGAGALVEALGNCM